MRDQFLLDPSVIFLNHGSFGACPRPVFDQYQAWQRDLERQPVEFLGRRYTDLYQHARAELATYLGTDADHLIFVENATAGLNIVARSLRLTAGDEILTTDHEYGALNLTWQYICRETGATIVAQALPDPLIEPQAVVDAIWAGVTERTRVLFLSHITSVTALILPIAQLIQRARAAGILTIIDGAHVPGHLALDLDALGADFYSGNLHKWLCAPKGSAFLYARPEHHEWLDPLVISWGWDGAGLFQRMAWQGTRDIAAFLTVPTAIEFQQAHDWAQIRQQCHALAMTAALRVCELFGTHPRAMPRFHGQMAIAPLPACDPAVVKRRLYDEYRVEIPITQHGDQPFVRISIQAYNTRADVERLLQALRAIFEIPDDA